MKGLKAAAFVQLNNGHHDNCHVINNHHHHHRLSDVNISSSRHHRLQSKADESQDEINIIANDNNANGIFLDLDTYLQAEETLLRPDGSLGNNNNSASANTLYNNNEAYQSAMQGLFPPTYSYYPDTKNEQDLSDEELLLQSVTNIQNDKSTMTQQQQLMDAETLHQQVFAEEQVYLEQSEEFRKSLSNNLQSSEDDYESPMARGRREAVEEYNQGILSDLLREIEEMEASAISREDALSRAQASGNFINNNDDDVMDVSSSAIEEGSSSTKRSTGPFCSQCGLTVTPDMTQRAKYGPQKLLCQACYGIKFRIKDEADVRLSQGPTIWESNNNRMSDQKMKRSNSRRTRLDTLRMNRGSVLDTSSLFRIPDSRMPNEQIQMPDDVTETPLTREVNDSMRLEDSSVSVSRSDSGPPPTRNTPTPIKPTKIVEDTKRTSGGSTFRSNESNAKKQSISKVSMKQESRSTSSRLLGGKALERRKTQHKSDDTGSIEQQQEVDDDIIEEEAVTGQDSSNEWIKVEDSTTKRIMYWNKQTGEMKRSID